MQWPFHSADNKGQKPAQFRFRVNANLQRLAKVRRKSLTVEPESRKTRDQILRYSIDSLDLISFKLLNLKP